MIKNILEEYIGLTLFIVTLLGLLYAFRERIFGGVIKSVRPAIDAYKQDYKTVKDASIASFSKDVLASITSPAINQQQFRGNIAKINAELIAKGITPKALALQVKGY